MDPVQLVAGVDGGGTQTRLVLEDLDGKEFARVRGGSTLVSPGQEQRVAHDIATLLRDALAQATAHARTLGDPPVWATADSASGVVSLVAGLAGVGDPAAREGVRKHLEATGVAQNVDVVNDTRVAFTDAFGPRDGILLIAGTGSHALARTPAGRWVRKGGWGLITGDEGSGWDLALRGIRAAIRGKERRSAPTDLSRWLSETLGSDEPAQWAHWVQHATKGDVAALAPGVVAVAQSGDTVAEVLVTSAIEDLLDHLSPILREFEDDGLRTHPALAMTGGLLAPGGALRARFLESVEAFSVHPIMESPDGARGGCTLARTLYRTGQLPA